MWGNSIDSETAERWGLVNCPVSRDDLDATVDGFFADMSEGPPISIQIAKGVINQDRDVDLDAAFVFEAEVFGLLSGPEEFGKVFLLFRRSKTGL